MDISINARVNCSDGPCGQVRRVIIKPTTEEITHLVISNEMIPETEYMVSIGRVSGSTPSLIRLSSSREELSKMPIFDKEEFVPAFMTTFNGLPYMMWPYYAPMFSNIPLEKEHIPADELVIRRGAQVEATDGHIGRVDEFLINPKNDHITHLVMREGHLWGQKDVTIPVDKIERYINNTVHLKLNKNEIEQLPSIPIRRSWAKTNPDAGNKGKEGK
jgi:sporulation protein YlmC with PRC-barrel domain